MSRRRWIIAGVVVLLLVVLVIIVVVATSSRGGPTSTLRARISRGTRPADAVFTIDSEGRYPGEAGWVDEGADVEVA